MPADKFKEDYMIVSRSKPKIRDIPVILPKINSPQWLNNLGEVSFQNNLWTLQVPDILVSHVAGYLHSPKKEFTVASDTSLLKDSFSLLTVKLNNPPNYIKSPTGLFFDNMRYQLKCLASQWVTALQLHKHNWQDKEFLDQVVYPGVANAVLSLETLVRLGRSAALPKTFPGYLRAKFVNAPISTMWPEDRALDEEIRKFFRDFRNQVKRQRFI